MFQRAAFAAIALALVSAGGCASGRMSNREPDRLFKQGQYDESIKRLEAGLKAEGENGRDLLLYLMDLGLVLHTAGRYEESNRYLLHADKIAEIKDYTSLAAEGATLLTSDNIKDYKGEDFEKILINTYLAMNYALMGNHEDALVEARRVNHKLHLMVTEGKRKYQQNAFARYLSAVVYEADLEFNDAYIDYQETWKLLPSFPGLGRDLWRMAWIMGMPDQMEKWEKEFTLTDEDKKAAKALGRGGRGRKGERGEKGEVVVLYENGISPIKRPHPSFYSIPKFYPRYNPVYHASIEVDGLGSFPTEILYDVERTAIENLDEKYAAIIAKKVAGVVVKEIIGNQIEKQTGNPLLGLAAKVVMYASDQADVRSWNLLPRDLQMVRIPVEPGTYTLRAHPEGDRLARVVEKKVTVEAGKKVFVGFRYVPE